MSYPDVDCVQVVKDYHARVGDAQFSELGLYKTFRRTKAARVDVMMMRRPMPHILELIVFNSPTARINPTDFRHAVQLLFKEHPTVNDTAYSDVMFADWLSGHIITLLSHLRRLKTNIEAFCAAEQTV